MRPLELILVAILLLLLIVRYIPILRKRNPALYLPFAATFLIPVHLVVDGYRWQMVPIFLFTFGSLTVSLIQMIKSAEKEVLFNNKLLRIIGRVFCILIFMLSVLFPSLLPVVNLPEPTGPYAVGTTSLTMMDEDRLEIFSEDPGDFRKLIVTAWYPARNEKGMSVSSYWDKQGVTGRAYSINADIGTFWYTHLSLVKTNSYKEADVSAEEEVFPVIIYSHSFYGLNTENTMLFEELASNGYIIFSISHTYENIVTVFPNGEIVTGNLDHISGLFDSNEEKEAQYYEDFRNAGDRDEKIELTNRILAVDQLSVNLLQIRTADARFVLDVIEKLNRGDGIFGSKLDLQRVGIMGWSFGGATAMEACIADNRFRAGINIDGTPYGGSFNAGATIQQPFMMIRSDSDDEMETIISDLVFERIRGSAYTFSIEHTGHSNFWDFPLFFRIYKYFGYWDSIDPFRLLEINRAYITGFFDQFLRGTEIDLLKGSSELYPEVNMRSKNGKDYS